MAGESALERLLKEREELVARVDALDAEIRSAKEQRREALLRELAALGISDTKPRRRPAGRAREEIRIKRQHACRLCGFTTIPPHDARSHRGQKPKRPFSDDELARKALARA